MQDQLAIDDKFNKHARRCVLSGGPVWLQILAAEMPEETVVTVARIESRAVIRHKAQRVRHRVAFGG